MPATSRVQVIIDAKDNASKVIKGLGKSFTGMGQSMKDVGRNLTMGVTAPLLAVGFAVGKLTERAGKVESVTDAFKGMIKGFEVGGEELIHNVKKATSGTIDQYKIMTSFLKASTLIGKEALGETGDNFTRMATIAKKAARATGQDVDFMFESIVNGIGRTSTKWLDNTGIVVKATDAYKTYADELGISTSQMTITQEKIALTNAYLEKAEEQYKNVAVSAGGYSSTLARLKVELRETADEIGLSMIPAVQGLVESITPVIRKYGPQLAEVIKKISKGFADLNPKIQGLTLGMVAFAVVLGPTLMLLGMIATGVTSLSFLISPLTLLIIGLAGWFFILKDSLKKGAKGLEYWETTVIPGIMVKFDEWKVKMGESKQAWSDMFESMGTEINEFNTRMGESIELWKTLFSNFISWYQANYIGPAKEGMRILRESFAMTGDQWTDALGQTLADMDNWIIGMLVRFETWKSYTSWAFQEVEREAVISFGNWLMKTDKALEDWTMNSFLKFAYWKMYTSWAFQEVERNAIISMGNWMIKTRRGIEDWSKSTDRKITDWVNSTSNSFIVWAERIWRGPFLDLQTNIETFVSQRMERWKTAIPMIWSEIADRWIFSLDRISNAFKNLKGRIDEARGGISAWWAKVQEARAEGAEFQTGGIVSGPIGAPVLAKVHAGERIIPAGISTPTGGGAGSIVFEVNIGMYVGTETEKRNIARELYGALMQVAQAQNKSVSELMGEA